MLLLLIESTIFTESSHRSKQKKADGYGDINVFNVISFGAIGDGTTDDSKGFKQAWDVACNSSTASSPTVLVPQGRTFLLQPLTFNGKSCTTSNYITFQIDGKIIAPSKPSAWECKPNCDHWISFRKCDGLLIQGSGSINGQGSKWWRISCKNKKKACPSRKPTGGHGHARNITFKHITSHASTHPIVIDQYYCPHKHCKNQTSAVEISNVRYEDIKGTSGRRIAVQLSCSESTPCTNILMKDISLRNKDQNDDTSSICFNAHGFTNSRVEPNVPCLQKHDHL
ncbi:hypothetical protein V6N13_084075 [Hibiscus sabdariffa]